MADESAPLTDSPQHELLSYDQAVIRFRELGSGQQKAWLQKYFPNYKTAGRFLEFVYPLTELRAIAINLSGGDYKGGDVEVCVQRTSETEFGNLEIPKTELVMVVPGAGFIGISPYASLPARIPLVSSIAIPESPLAVLRYDRIQQGPNPLARIVTFIPGSVPQVNIGWSNLIAQKMPNPV